MGEKLSTPSLEFAIHVLIGAAAYLANDDQEFVSFLKTHCKAPLKVVNATTIEERLDTINYASTLVSGRFHHSIAAFCFNTPFIAFNSNTHKVQAICSLLDQPEPLYFSDDFLFDHLVQRTEMIMKGPMLKNDAKIAEICELAEKNFEGLLHLKVKQNQPVKGSCRR